MKFSSFGTLFLDHNVSQLFVMPQFTIAERQFLVVHYFKRYRYVRNNGSVDVDELKANIIRVIYGTRQETLASLFANMLTRLELCVDHLEHLLS